MIALPGITEISHASTRLIAWWNAVVARWHPVILIIVAWALLTIPLVFFRGFNSDEGVAVTIARTAIDDGYWLTPHMFNERFVERPTLLSWIIAAISLPFGSVSQFTARLPIILALLGGCLLIYSLLRRVGASIAAAVLGAALFLTCPVVLRSYVMTTADMPLAVLLFTAFVIWWNGHALGRVSISRWAVIGVVLALAALLKGPQPVAYFALGVGLFILVNRSWRQIPGLVLAGVICVIPLVGWYAYVYVPGDELRWASFMRLKAAAPLSSPPKALLELIGETLPAMLLATVFFVTQGFRGNDRVTGAFVKVIACYAFTATLVILFWPGGATARYFLPMVLPLCVLGALGFDALKAERPLIVVPGLLVALAILAYAFVYSVVASPLLPNKFRLARIDAARITEAVRDAPGPIYRTAATGLNVLPYVPRRVIGGASVQTLETVDGPAWFAVPVEEANILLAKRGNALHVVMPFGSDEEWRLLRLDK